MNGWHLTLDKFIDNLPKVELHAHINGSISEATIHKLLVERDSYEDKAVMDRLKEQSKALKNRENQTLNDCFATFDLMHQLCDSTNAAYMITKDVIEDFMSDNVKYLELRTTPRDVAATGMTKDSYIVSVLKAIEESNDRDVMVRLLLAIDRGRHSVEEAQQVVDLADKYRNLSAGVVVGVDLSGDPSKGDARLYIPALRNAKARGLKLALHLAELANQNEECEELLKLPPDRVGHGTFLSPERGGTQANMDVMVAHKIPVEACLTSNVRLQTVASYTDHHLIKWRQRNHPYIICTDDKGVFNTSLSAEYKHAAQAFDLSHDDIWQLSYNAIDCIFENEHVKDDLKARWRHWRESERTK